MMFKIFSENFSLAPQYTIGQVLSAIGIIFLTAVLAKVLQWIGTVRINQISRKEGNEYYTNLGKYILAPFHTIVFLTGFRFSLRILYIDDISNPVTKVFRIAFVITTVWLLYRLSHFFRDRERSKLTISERRTYSIYAMTSKLFNFVIISIGLIVILNEYGYSVSSLLAGLGIGGIAVALASKETLSSVISSVIIAIDKPFTIGDVIKLGNVEGYVEDIGFRVIKLRLPDKTLVTIPNSLVSVEKVENISRRSKQKVVSSIVVSGKSSPENLNRCLEKMRKILDSFDLVNKENSHVSFSDFKDSNPVISVTYFVESVNETEFQKTRNDINMELYGIIKEMGIDFNQ
ncbi:MAG: mechanosensitive ion channel family protein [Firmicutes bacterium]|nr:mechanosensitive ion channel family protein [Bacillota bacterium]